ncbi:cytochrome P460 family protein [Sulfitobacter sabulilitoris]|uniref:Cytochrome P460 domain-containing protein n=1 Tax=Sulfitobacter sabulilitoris TaxID=2562655 RepID=A0A5S3PLB3_9RHOB|nr:cytochrome P460 family protein [Sulfitobacter sabulilitoris]TMM54350.1 hypothetical protein FDT80_01785 [Sulfitobacter sabulilitoris]
MKKSLIGIALVVSATTALSQQLAGTEADKSYAAELWARMEALGLTGDSAIQAFPYQGVEPHGLMLQTFYTRTTIDGHTGALVVKRNYGPEGVSVDEILSNPDDHLGSITVMFQREADYDPETGNWFWAKYLADGTLDQNPAGMALAGLVGKGAEAGCIACHQDAGGGDYLFTTDADLTVE